MGGTFSYSSNANTIQTFSNFCQNYRNCNDQKQQENNLFDISTILSNNNLSSYK